MSSFPLEKSKLYTKDPTVISGRVLAYLFNNTWPAVSLLNVSDLVSANNTPSRIAIVEI